MTLRTLSIIILSAIAVVNLLSGCANLDSGASYRPIVDGGILTHYERDLTACQQVARQRKYLNDDAITDAAVGAIIGSLAGSGGNRNDIIGSALIGGTLGAATKVVDAHTERKNIVINCMRQRGYNTVESNATVVG